MDLGASPITTAPPREATAARPRSLGLALRKLADRTSRFLFLLVLPVLLATVWMRYFVPTPAEAEGTWAAPIARFGDERTLLLWVILLLVFSAFTGYWSFLLPGAQPNVSKRGVLGLVVVVGFSAGAALLLRGTFGTFRVLSGSMLPTLEPEDVVVGRQLMSGMGDGAAVLPHRGDIIVFRKPAGLDGPDELVKRVIGLPGDRIGMNGGHPVINGWEVPSCDAGGYLFPLPDGSGVAGRLFVEFLDGRAHLAIYATTTPEWQGPYDVRPGEVFVIGDNRNNSSDSRAWNKGKGAGLPVASVDARIEHWLFGMRRDDRVDVGQLLHPLELFVRLDGMDTSPQREYIAECLKKWPSQTSPPPARPPGSG
jgi:signal peptidase I